MMNFKTTLKPTSSLIDLTPLVDVMFLLLIFFMATSNMSPLRSLNVSVPELEKESIPLMTELIVTMDAQQVIYVGDKQEIVDPSELKQFLLKEIELLKHYHPKRRITTVLNIDRHTDYGSFLHIFSLVREISPAIRLVYKKPYREQTSSAI